MVISMNAQLNAVCYSVERFCFIVTVSIVDDCKPQSFGAQEKLVLKALLCPNDLSRLCDRPEVVSHSAAFRSVLKMCVTAGPADGDPHGYRSVPVEASPVPIGRKSKVCQMTIFDIFIACQKHASFDQQLINICSKVSNDKVQENEIMSGFQSKLSTVRSRKPSIIPVWKPGGVD